MAKPLLREKMYLPIFHSKIRMWRENSNRATLVKNQSDCWIISCRHCSLVLDKVKFEPLIDDRLTSYIKHLHEQTDEGLIEHI